MRLRCRYLLFILTIILLAGCKTTQRDAWRPISGSDPSLTANEARSICGAQAEVAEVNAETAIAQTNAQQQGTGNYLSALGSGMKEQAAGSKAYQATMTSCMANYGYVNLD
jgi:hypothetical protein